MAETVDPILIEITERLSAKYNPEKIYLFGSRARGDFNEDSDYDLLLIVKESNLNRLDRMTEARDALSGLGISADVFVYTVKEFDEWKNDFSSIPEIVSREGQELTLG